MQSTNKSVQASRFASMPLSLLSRMTPMTTATEQFSSAIKANLEGNIAFFSTLSHKAFEGVEKLTDLHLTTLKTSLAEAKDRTDLFAAKDASELLSLGTGHAQPALEKTFAYGQHLASIVSGTQAELVKTAENHLADSKRSFSALLDETSSKLPAGYESVTSYWKSAFGQFNTHVEQFSQSAKQAVSLLENNVSSAAAELSEKIIKPAARATKK
ncbi:phasin family protein [Herbaspirillum sp. RTI4]|uniref:phasin family protein n=1 Tax=Herbaspirillum sp. RTI4 TaxID=3048640 RepID=UPI002AB3D232|nr:phasin family protein [Herbaspirillum sp. RTI4]MDY7579703.1 phasin family protein [Herbaspirillum sp. RTI4]MEA9983030.1 phasin family protein [Herbaspirillum sp. RTI4]